MCDDPQWKQRLGPPSSHRYSLDLIFDSVLKQAFLGNQLEISERKLGNYTAWVFTLSHGFVIGD